MQVEPSFDWAGLPYRNIACIDMRSFYASCAAALEGLDVMKTPIAVIGNKERKGSVVLAASPPLKKLGVTTGMRLYEIPDHPSIRLIEPHMQFYIDVSMEITRLLNQYVPKEAIHVYSIDESFFNIDGVSRLWGTPEETIQQIQNDLYNQFQLPSAVGMGPNMLISKLALDLEGKKTGFARWRYQDIPKKLWPIAPLSKMWGIGSRMEKSLNNVGIFSVGDLARTDLKMLESRYGVMGNQLYHHAWGIDLSELGSPYIEGQISYGKGQVLFRDYVKRSEIATVLLEISEDIAMRARLARKAGRTIQLSIGYSKNALGGGFSRSQSMYEPTNDTMTIYKMCLQLLDKFHDGRPVRNVSVSLSNVEEETSMQMDLFEKDKWRQRKLGATMDEIRMKFGQTAILRAVSYTDAGTAIERAKLIGGHKQ